MKYITNDDGDVQVYDAKGNPKWLPKHLAENEFLMKQMELTPVEAPVNLPPTEPIKTNEPSLTPISFDVEASVEDNDFEIETVKEEKKQVKPKK